MPFNTPRPTRTAAVLALVVTGLSGGIPAPGALAIEVCRENALGQIACAGKPTPGLRPLVPFHSRRNGLDRVQVRVDPDKPGLISSERTNAFGETFLREGETRRPKPRICRQDAFGNFIC